MYPCTRDLGPELRWAAEHPDRVCSVVTFGAPLYLDRAEANEHVAGMGQMEAFLGGDGPVPRAVCAAMCRHRSIASWVAIAYRPDLPVPVARLGVRHTWHTYTGSLDGLIRDAGWSTALGVLSHAGIPVTLAVGIADAVPVLGRAQGLAGTWPGVRHVVHPRADHGLPFTDPEWCRALVADAVTEGLHQDR